MDFQADSVAVGVGAIAGGFAKMLDQSLVRSRYHLVVHSNGLKNESLAFNKWQHQWRWLASGIGGRMMAENPLKALIRPRSDQILAQSGTRLACLVPAVCREAPP